MFDGLNLTESQMQELRKSKDAIWQNLRSDVELFPDVGQVLLLLKARYQLAIATTAPRNYVEFLLTKDQVIGNFKEVVTNADVSTPKPDPEMLIKIAARLCCPLKESCMVGDTVSDFRMSKAAGSGFILFGDSSWRIDPAEALNCVHLNTWKELASFFSVTNNAVSLV